MLLTSLAVQLVFTQVALARRLHLTKNLQKVGKWVPHEFITTQKGSWANSIQQSIFPSVRNSFGSKVVLCVSLDQYGSMYWELLNPDEAVTATRLQ